MEALAAEIRKHMPPPALLLLSGPLAAGKTTFAGCFCRIQGLPFTQSPTYAIHQRYENAAVRVDHFDLYRLENEDELQAAGVYDLLAEPADYQLIEWPERLHSEDLPLGREIYRLELRPLGAEPGRKAVLSRAEAAG